MKRLFLALLISALVASPVFAQLSQSAEWAAVSLNKYDALPDVTYLTANGYESKLDIYRRADVTTPQPTVIYFHGGGWIRGSKEASLMSIIPWLEMGWNVVNVEYRMLQVAPAPAAVEDALCALRFIVSQAKTYRVDTNRIVVSGGSAGGHLALAAGMIPESAGFTNICAGGLFAGAERAVPRVAAIINWYGITDVAEMLAGPNARAYALQWLGSASNKEEIARSVSPINYVRAGLPPILSIQGDADPIVPYSQNVRLHAALTKAGIANELFTVPKGGHGGFSPDERKQIYGKIREFLARHGLAGVTQGSN